MVSCSKAVIGTCCTEERTGKPAFKYSKTNVTLMSPKCMPGTAVTTSQTDPYGHAAVPLKSRFNPASVAKGMPVISTRPTAATPKCGQFFGNRGFACCCKGLAGCPPDGITFTKDRAGCCNNWGQGGGRCFNDTPASAYKPITPSARPTSRTLPPTSAARAPAPKPYVGTLRSRFNNYPVQTPVDNVYTFDQYSSQPSDTLPGGAPIPNPGGPPVKKQDFVTILCPYFRWVPIGPQECNMQVITGVAIVALGGALLIKMIKGR